MSARNTVILLERGCGCHEPSRLRSSPRLCGPARCRFPGEHFLEQPGLEGIDLLARVAEAGHLDHRLAAELQQGAAGKGEQIDPSGGDDVLPELSGVDVEPVLADLSEQLSVDEVDLPQVRLRWIGGDPRSVLDGDALVGVALHSESRHQHDLIDDCLAEAVFTIPADGEHPSLLIDHPAKSPRLLPGEEPASESDGTPAGAL